MWGALLAGAFFTAINPVRLAVLALLIARPRPLPNLFFYWVGAWAFGIPTLVIPLLALNATPMVSSLGDGFFSSDTYRQLQFGVGVFVAFIAVLMIARTPARQRARIANAKDVEQSAVPDPDQLSPLHRLFAGADTRRRGIRTPIRSLLHRAHEAWESGALWVSALLGALTGGPSLDGIFMGLGIIMTSGTALNTQVIACVVWVFAMLALVEIILLSFVVSPARAESLLEVLHEWLQRHRRKILIGILLVVGIALAAQNFSSVWSVGQHVDMQ